MNGPTTVITSGSDTRAFTFDHSIWSTAEDDPNFRNQV